MLRGTYSLGKQEMGTALYDESITDLIGHFMHPTIKPIELMSHNETLVIVNFSLLDYLSCPSSRRLVAYQICQLLRREHYQSDQTVRQ
jgi:hypothetical protein